VKPPRDKSRTIMTTTIAQNSMQTKNISREEGRRNEEMETGEG